MGVLFQRLLAENNRPIAPPVSLFFSSLLCANSFGQALFLVSPKKTLLRSFFFLSLSHPIHFSLTNHQPKPTDRTPSFCFNNHHLIMIRSSSHIVHIFVLFFHCFFLATLEPREKKNPPPREKSLLPITRFFFLTGSLNYSTNPTQMVQSPFFMCVCVCELFPVCLLYTTLSHMRKKKTSST